MKNELLYPMATYVFYIAGLGVYLLLSRVQALKERQVHFKYFQTYTGNPPPEKAIVIGRHYDNQFQVPVLFFITGLMHLVLNTVSTWTIALMWAFVVSRFFHSYIHLGSNNVRHRVIGFGIGWLIIVALWIQLICTGIL